MHARMCHCGNGAMIAVEILNNASRPLASVIRERFASADSASIAVAFLRKSGLRSIEQPFLRLLARGGTVECILGFDYMFTEPDALSQMAEWMKSYDGFRFLAYETSAAEDQGCYHPKLYIIRESGAVHVIVGSSNLTRGGMRTNLEANALISGGPEAAPIVQAERLYEYVRNQERVFVPDADYLDGYSVVYELYRSVRRRAGDAARAARLRMELRRREAALPGTVPTQKDLVVEAIRRLREAPDAFVSLRDIYVWVDREARRRRIQFKWETLQNSVRGRLNEHTVGKGGDDLFERMGGVTGRYGRYRLTDAGDQHRMRRTLEPSE